MSWQRILLQSGAPTGGRSILAVVMQKKFGLVPTARPKPESERP